MRATAKMARLLVLEVIHSPTQPGLEAGEEGEGDDGGGEEDEDGGEGEVPPSSSGEVEVASTYSVMGTEVVVVVVMCSRPEGPEDSPLEEVDCSKMPEAEAMPESPGLESPEPG